MKILGIILAVLMLAGSATLGFAGYHRSSSAAAELDAISDELRGAPSEELGTMTAELPSAARLKAGAIVGLLGAIAAAGLLVLMFARRSWVAVTATVAVALTALSAAIYPYVATGPHDDLAPRTQALLAIGLVVGGGLAVTLAARRDL